mmetsp:Transcript_15678/g.45274  ORF Transcript_15678/g.45274 Transcript_15678/m.45274 type:complete len:491 (-) Transcript_15678:150-1622(-)
MYAQFNTLMRCNSLLYCLLLILLEENSGVVPTEAQVGAHGSLDLHLPLIVGNIVQIAFRICGLVVDSRRDDTVGNTAGNDNSLETTSSSQGVASHALGRTDDELAILGCGMIAKDCLDGHGLEFVIVGRRGTVSIDVVDVGGIQTGHLHGHIHCLGKTTSLGRRGGNVMRIARGAVSHHLTVNFGPTLLGTLQALQKDGAGTLSHNEATAIGIERSGSRYGIVVGKGRHGLHGTETGVAKRGDGGLGTTGNHHVGVPIEDHAVGLADGVAGTGAGRGDAVVRSTGTGLNANDARGRVAQQGRDGEGTDLGPAGILGQLERFAFKGLHPAEGRADEDTAPVRIGQGVGRVADAGILEGEAGAGHGQVGVAVVGLGILGVGKVVLGIEHLVGNLGTDLAGIRRGIEALHLAQTGLAVDAGLEEVVVADAAAADDAEARDYHPLRIGLHVQRASHTASCCPCRHAYVHARLQAPPLEGGKGGSIRYPDDAQYC